MSGSERRPIGGALDNLGIRVTLDAGELLAGAVVLVKILQVDGSTRLALADSEGLGWLERAGMLSVAARIDAESDHVEGG